MENGLFKVESNLEMYLCKLQTIQRVNLKWRTSKYISGHVNIETTLSILYIALEGIKDYKLNIPITQRAWCWDTVRIIIIIYKIDLFLTQSLIENKSIPVPLPIHFFKIANFYLPNICKYLCSLMLSKASLLLTTYKRDSYSSCLFHEHNKGWFSYVESSNRR